MGLFLSPINASTGLGIVSISFALAVGQFFLVQQWSIFPFENRKFCKYTALQLKREDCLFFKCNDFVRKLSLYVRGTFVTLLLVTMTL
jgi:hypothetical protein